MLPSSASSLISLANRLADSSGAIIRPYFREQIPVDIKTDASPVTIADREAEKAIREILMEVRPKDGIIGEEFPNENTDAEHVWVIDPIDGTKSFISGRPIFGTLIALTWNGMPVLGVIDQPISGERWIGLRNHGASLSGMPIQTRECSSLADATIGTTAPDLFDADGRQSWQRAAKAARHVVYGGDCYTYALVASGLVDAVIESGLQAYDFAALSPIIEEAGGIASDWEGNPLTLSSDGHVIACGDRRVHAELLELVSG